MSTNKAILVYVWIGKKLPKWSHRAIEISKKTSKAEIHFILSRQCKIKVTGINYHYLEDFYKEPSQIFPNGYGLNKNFRNGFWFKTTERFFVLEQFMEKHGFSEIFHAELDNLVFNINELNLKLNQIGNGCFVPRDSIERGIASLVYINKIESVKAITGYFSHRNFIDANNDMQILGNLILSNDLFYPLPTESNAHMSNITSQNSMVSVKQVNGVFDAAAIGQFLFSYDPNVVANLLIKNRFLNENLKFDFDTVTFTINIRNSIANFTLKDSNHKLNIYNIHVHSKLFNLIDNAEKLEKIVNTINKGGSSVLKINILNFVLLNIRSLIGRFYRKLFH